MVGGGSWAVDARGSSLVEAAPACRETVLGAAFSRPACRSVISAAKALARTTSAQPMCSRLLQSRIWTSYPCLPSGRFPGRKTGISANAGKSICRPSLARRFTPKRRCASLLDAGNRTKRVAKRPGQKARRPIRRTSNPRPRHRARRRRRTRPANERRRAEFRTSTCPRRALETERC